MRAYWLIAWVCMACGGDVEGTEAETGVDSENPTAETGEPDHTGTLSETGTPTDTGTPTTTDSGTATTEPKAGGVPADLPVASEVCPPLVDGDNTILGRQVRIWVDPDTAKKGGGPFVFYWYASLSAPQEAELNFAEVITEVVAQGGLVIAPYNEPCQGCDITSGIPWWYAEDYVLGDEVLACAIEQFDIDTSRIHAAGVSAGGMHTGEMLYQRSNYLASIATYSGGITPTKKVMADATNLVPAMVMYGRKGDFLAGASDILIEDLDKRGHFNFECAHNRGHGIAAPLAPSVWQFFDTHRYRTASPWAVHGLPAELDESCFSK